MENITLIYALNKEETMRMIPVISILITICLLGLCGNGVSLYIFTTYFKTSNSRLFFIYLSSVELFACCILIPFDIAALFQQLVLISGYLCVAYIFLLVFQVQVAADILVVIAVDRWRKICHPFKWQLSYKLSKVLCIATLFLGFIEALPSLGLYGAHTVHADYNITGQDCSIKDSVRETVYPVVYMIFFWSITIVRITLLSVLYFNIMRTVRQHDNKVVKREIKYHIESGSIVSEHEKLSNRTYGHKKRENPSQISEGTTTEHFESVKIECSTQVISDITMGSNENDSLNSLALPINEKVKVTDDTQDTRDDLLPTNDDNNFVKYDLFSNKIKSCDEKLRLEDLKSVKQNLSKVNTKRARTVTIIMFTVTVTCIAIYMPYLILASLRAIVEEYECVLSHKERVAYKFFVRSYFWKAVINPLVYGIFDPRFRHSLKAIIRRSRQQSYGQYIH